MGLCNISVLTRFVSALDGNNDRTTVFSAIYAVARALVDAKLSHFGTDRLAIAPVPQREAGKTC